MSPGITTMCPVAVKPLGIRNDASNGHSTESSIPPVQLHRARKALFGGPDRNETNRIFNELNLKNKNYLQTTYNIGFGETETERNIEHCQSSSLTRTTTTTRADDSLEAEGEESSSAKRSKVNLIEQESIQWQSKLCNGSGSNSNSNVLLSAEITPPPTGSRSRIVREKEKSDSDAQGNRRDEAKSPADDKTEQKLVSDFYKKRKSVTAKSCAHVQHQRRTVYGSQHEQQCNEKVLTKISTASEGETSLLPSASSEVVASESGET